MKAKPTVKARPSHRRFVPIGSAPPTASASPTSTAATTNSTTTKNNNSILAISFISIVSSLLQSRHVTLLVIPLLPLLLLIVFNNDSPSTSSFHPTRHSIRQQQSHNQHVVTFRPAGRYHLASLLQVRSFLSQSQSQPQQSHQQTELVVVPRGSLVDRYHRLVRRERCPGPAGAGGDRIGRWNNITPHVALLRAALSSVRPHPARLRPSWSVLALRNGANHTTSNVDNDINSDTTVPNDRSDKMNGVRQRFAMAVKWTRLISRNDVLTTQFSTDTSSHSSFSSYNLDFHMRAIHRTLSLFLQKKKITTVVVFPFPFRFMPPALVAAAARRAGITDVKLALYTPGVAVNMLAATHVDRQLALLARAKQLLVNKGEHAALAAVACTGRVFVTEALHEYLYLSEEDEEEKGELSGGVKRRRKTSHFRWLLNDVTDIDDDKAAAAALVRDGDGDENVDEYDDGIVSITPSCCAFEQIGPARICVNDRIKPLPIILPSSLSSRSLSHSATRPCWILAIGCSPPTFDDDMLSRTPCSIQLYGCRRHHASSSSSRGLRRRVTVHDDCIVATTRGRRSSRQGTTTSRRCATLGETIDAGAEAAGMKGVVPTLVRIDATAMMSEKEYEGSSNGDDGDDERDGDGDGMVTMVRTLIGMDAAMTIDEEMEMNRIGSRSRRAERSRRREWIRKMGFKNEHEMPSQMIIHLRTASKDSNEDDEEEKVRKWLRILRHSGYVTVTRGDSSSSATGRCKNCVAVTVMRNAAVRGTADVPVWT